MWMCPVHMHIQNLSMLFYTSHCKFNIQHFWKKNTKQSTPVWLQSMTDICFVTATTTQLHQKIIFQMSDIPISVVLFGDDWWFEVGCLICQAQREKSSRYGQTLCCVLYMRTRLQASFSLIAELHEFSLAAWWNIEPRYQTAQEEVSHLFLTVSLRDRSKCSHSNGAACIGVLQLLCSTTRGQCFIRDRPNSIKTKEADKEIVGWESEYLPLESYWILGCWLFKKKNK